MSTQLPDKINSYSIERGIALNETQSGTTAPTTTGSNTTSQTWTYSGSGTIQTVDGPVPGQKAWQFPLSTSSGVSRRLRNTGDDTSLVSDNSYSFGIWFKALNFPSRTTLASAVIFAGIRPVGRGILISSLYNEVSGDPNYGTNTLQIAIGDTTSWTGGLDTNKWYYLAVRRDGSDATIYLNNNLLTTLSNITIDTTSSMIGYDLGTTSSSVNQDIIFGPQYIAPYSTITSTEIQEIYLAGTEWNGTITPTPMQISNAEMIHPSISTSVNFLQTAAIADTEILMPTIVVVANNSVNVTTFISSSVEFPSNYLVIASQNINFIVTEILTATTTIGDNITISTGSNASYSAQEMTATALITESRVSENPFIASATMPGGVATIPQNYYNLVKQLNPYVYINNGATSPVNNGFQSGNFVKGTSLSTLQDGGLPLNIIAEGKSWKGSATSNSDGWISFEPTNFSDSFNSLIGTGAFAYEVWVKPLSFPNASQNSSTTDISFTILRSDKLQLNLEDAYISNPRYISLIIYNTLSGSTELKYLLDSSPLTLNTWNHIVINVYQSGINTNERLVQLWINGQIIINQNISFTAYTDTTAKANRILGGKAVSLQYLTDMFYDELAIYKSANATTPALTNSQIIQHNNFINNTSPNFTHNATPLTANAESGNHQSPTNSNINIAANPSISDALFVMPAISIQKTINYSSSPMIASALNTEATAFWGRTVYTDFMTASAFKPESYFLNNIYYNYVQTNIAPYRYVNFDTSNVYADFGSDNDYSVIPTTIGGSILNPGLSINGKSALTTGSSYVTDGVILKESEHDDNWGTGNASWHSSFWMTRSLEDNSTGLRVLWNLNGKNDDQHVVLYHYQSKLHLQINDQVGSAITITTANNIDPFDFNPHHFVIRHHHNNNKNYLYLYVDGNLVADQDIDVYKVTTINNPIHVGPNDENNNFPRLSVGCLITTFANTSLPVQPTNTKIIIDEIYWDKNDINQTAVTNLYNAMPGQANKVIAVEPLTASDEFVMPVITFSSNISTATKTASSQFIDPTLYLERIVSTSADLMTASAEMAEASGFVPVNINADVMTANGTFSFGLAEVTIPGPTMYASAIFKTENLYLNVQSTIFYPDSVVTPWVAYLRATDVGTILATREVI